MCLWPALLPFNVNRFWRNLVTRTVLWSSLATTIMVQIGRRGTARRLFENFKKISKITEFEFQNSGPSFFASCLLCIVKNLDSIRAKLTEVIYFERCPYGDSGSGTAGAARCLPAYSNWTGRAAACCDRSSGAFRTGSIRNWGRNRAVKTHRLVYLFLCYQLCAKTSIRICMKFSGQQVRNRTVNRRLNLGCDLRYRLHTGIVFRSRHYFGDTKSA